MKKIAHIADVHLRDSHYGSTARRNDFFNGFMNAIKAAKAAGAEIIIMAGDVTNSTKPSPFIVDSLRLVEEWLVKNEMLALVVSGNHDATDPHWVEVISSRHEKYGMHYLSDTSYADDDVTVWGLPMLSPADVKAVLADTGRFADILTFHGELAEFIDFPIQNAVSVQDFPEGKYKVVAMGHIHVHRKYERPSDGLVVAYPGSTELCNVKEDEHKSFYMYTFDKHKLLKVEDIPFETRPVIIGDIKTEADLTKVIEFMEANSEKGALVVVRFDTQTVENCSHRLYALNAGGKHIIRAYAMPVSNTTGKAVTINIDDEGDVREIESFIPVFLGKNSSEFVLATVLVNPESDVIGSIREYVRNRRQHQPITTNL